MPWYSLVAFSSVIPTATILNTKVFKKRFDYRKKLKTMAAVIIA